MKRKRWWGERSWAVGDSGLLVVAVLVLGQEMLADAKDERKEKKRNRRRRRRRRREGGGTGLRSRARVTVGCRPLPGKHLKHLRLSSSNSSTNNLSKQCDHPEDFLGPQNVWQKMPAPWTICEVSSPWCYGDVSPGWQKSDVGVLAKVWEPILSSYCSSPLNIPRTFERTFPVNIVCVSIQVSSIKIQQFWEAITIEMWSFAYTIHLVYLVSSKYVSRMVTLVSVDLLSGRNFSDL